MSRITYAEDEDFPNQGALWEANQQRSLKGKKGQVALRETEAALLALPTKRLIAEELENELGEVCVVGALARYKGQENPRIGDTYGDDADANTILPDEIEQYTIHFAQELGMPRLVAISLVERNDDSWWNRIQKETPEQRYQRVLSWVQRQIIRQTL